MTTRIIYHNGKAKQLWRLLELAARFNGATTLADLVMEAGK